MCRDDECESGPNVILQKLAAIVVLPLSLMLTTAPAQARQAGRGVISIRLEAFDDRAQTAALNRVVSRFEKKNKRIRVTFSPNAGESQLETEFLNKQAPDVFEVDMGWSSDFAKVGVLQREDTYAGHDRSFVAGDFSRALVRGFSYRRRDYVYPLGYTTLGLWYNRPLLKSAHLKPPGDWKSFVRDACTLTNRTTKVLGASLSPDAYHWFAFLGGFGARVLNAKSTTPAIVSKQSVQALTWYTGMVKRGCAQTPASDSSNVEAFASGQAAMTVEPSTLIPELRSMGPRLSWGVTQLPAGPKGASNIADAVGFALNARSAHKNAAWSLIRFLDSQATMKALDAAANYLPARNSLKPPKGMSPFAKGNSYARQWTWPPGLVVNAFPHISDDIKSAGNGGMSPQAAVADMGSWLQQYL